MKRTNDSGKIDFIGKIGLFTSVSAILVVVSLFYLFVHGLNYGIDFTGGTEVQIKLDPAVKISEVRDFANSMNYKSFEIQQFDSDGDFVIRFQTEAGATDKETNDKLQAAIEKTRADIAQRFTNVDIRRIDTVGPQIGAELQKNSFLAVFYCLLVILIYVALRFDYKYAPGAVLCLFHDTVITLGLFVLVGKEVNVPTLAAVLTLIGYSLNDTIVVFDRIRETEAEGAYREKGIKFIINKSINDMLGRTVITSSTTLVSALALWIFAGGTIADIAFVLAVGITIGTYSSIYVAAPLIIVFDKLKLKPTT